MAENAITSLAARIEVDLSSSGVCPACLSFVSFALEEGDERRIAGQVRKMAPDLWEDGLGPVVRAALIRAAGSGDPGAAEALRDLGERGARSAIFQAVVRRLAGELAEESRRAYPTSLN